MNTMKIKSGKNLVSISLLLIVFSSCSIFKSSKKPESKSVKSEYEQKLGFQLNSDFNEVFIKEILKHLNAPYKFGGEGVNGFDCSGLVSVVYKNIFKISVPRRSTDMYLKSKKRRESELKQGDLYFFKINGKEVDHVGMHIQDKYFIHASTKAGVIISSLTEPYYQKTFVSYGSFF